MADERLKIDANYWKVSGAVTDDSNLDIVMLRADPVTKRLKVEQSPLVSSVDNVQVINATSPTIYNLTLTDANTEYSQALPANTTKYVVQCRTDDDVKMSFTSGESGTKYLTIHGGQSYWEDLVKISPTLYFQSATAGVVVEIVAWTQ